jgi:hypothetical protein
MTTLAHLIRFESPHSGLAFRKYLYGPGDEDEVVADCLALANAEVKGRRFLIIGVDAADAENRRLRGVDRGELARFRKRFERLLARCVEPELDATVRAVELDGKLIGYVRIEQGEAPPYLATRALGKKIQAGQGYIRRGSKNYPLRRSDLKRMFANVEVPQKGKPPVCVRFAGNEPSERLTLPALSVSRLPSELAAERLKGMLEMHDQARERFGRTETGLSRLMYAKLYGAEVPFEKHSDQSLVSALQNVDIDYSAADAHYLYEVRAHRLNLLVSNDSESSLHGAVLEVTVPRVEGTGLAERVFDEDKITSRASSGYPAITPGKHTVSIRAELGTLYAGRSVRAFVEPARFWARPAAAGKAVPLDFELGAEELEAPIRGSLIIYIENPAA